MSENAKKPEDRMPDLPERFLVWFRCIQCKKYLRPPIMTICQNGHNVCAICYPDLETDKCPEGTHSLPCKREDSSRNVAVENIMKELKLPMSCKNHAAGCDFSGSLEDEIAHEEGCPYRSVKCVVLSCYQDIRFNDLETHMVEKHSKMSTGEWEIICVTWIGAVPSGLADVLLVVYPTFGEHRFFAMRSWHHRGTRFFATLFYADWYWHLWVTAACGKTAAEKFRAEIRLSSNLKPGCNDVSYRDVLHMESPILSERISVNKYDECLHVGERTVANHINGTCSARLEEDTVIPFTVKVYEKVFLTLDKADIEEKDE